MTILPPHERPLPIRLVQDIFPADGHYAIGDSDFLLYQLAQGADLGFANMAGVNRLKTDHRKAISQQLRHLMGHETGLVGSIAVGPSAMAMVEDLALMIRKLYAEHGNAVPKKIITSFSFVPEEGDVRLPHRMVGVVDRDEEGKLHFTLLEQHINPHEKNRDFITDQWIIGKAFARELDAQLHLNLEPYCREKEVCAVVSHEVVKTIALSEKPGYYFAEHADELTMDHAAVIKAHAANRRLADRHKRNHRTACPAPKYTDNLGGNWTAAISGKYIER
jgi:hypothetical protein